MLGGFDPRLEEVFFRRRRGRAITGALFVYVASVVLAMWIAPEHEPAIDVQLEPEIQDFAIDEDEPEPEIEQEPPPPPPPDAKVKVVDKPKPKPKLAPPDKKVTEAPDEASERKTIEVGRGTPQPGGTGTGQAPEPKPRQEKPRPAHEDKPKPKATPKAIDPTQPIDRPEKATAPKPAPDNPKPTYPPTLRDKGVTGSVLVKLHVHRDGTVRGMKVLKKSNNAATEDEKKQADALFLKAVVAAVQKWTYTPAQLDGEPITVWHKVNIPFSLTGGD